MDHSQSLEDFLEEMELRVLGDQDGRAEYWRGESCRETETENHGDLQKIFLMYPVEYLSAHIYAESNQGQGNHLEGLEITGLASHTGPR